MTLIDSHCHLEEIDNLELAIDRARSAGLVTIIAVGSDYQSNLKVLGIAAAHRGLVYPALGIHPASLSASGADQDLQSIQDHVNEVKAVGEIGLDYHKKVIERASKERQKSVLREALAIARKHHKPAIIHSRYAWRDALSIVAESGVERAVFHWFTGPTSVLKDIVEMGYFISATPAAEYHQEHRRAVKTTPLDNLLIETDSPVSYGMEPRWTAEPADVVRTLRAAVEVRGISEEVLAEITTRNAIRFFELPL